MDGLWHALTTERNLILFVCVYGVVLIVALYVHIQRWEWIALIISGFTFVCIELLNTALERFVDAFDEYRRQEHGSKHYHLGLKATKDVAAAASLVSLACVILTIWIVFCPSLQQLIPS